MKSSTTTSSYSRQVDVSSTVELINSVKSSGFKLSWSCDIVTREKSFTMTCSANATTKKLLCPSKHFLCLTLISYIKNFLSYVVLGCTIQQKYRETKKQQNKSNAKIQYIARLRPTSLQWHSIQRHLQRSHEGPDILFHTFIKVSLFHLR